jgi:hypothetical protein
MILIKSYNRLIFLIIFILQMLFLLLSIKMESNLTMMFNYALLIIIVSFILLLIKKRIFLYVFLLGTLISTSMYLKPTFGFLYYTPHFLLLLMLLKIILNYKNFISDKTIMIISLILTLFGLIPILNFEYDFGLVSIFYALLMKFSFIIVYLFVINITNWDQGDSKKLFKCLVIFFIANIIYTLYQFLFTDVNGDNMTGFFGYQGTGIAAYFYCFFLVILCSYNYKKRISTTILFIVATTIIFISAINETKILFVYIPIILIIYFLFIKKSFKSIIIISLFFGILIITYSILISLYPTQDFLNREFIERYTVNSSYDSLNSVNRLNFKETIDYYILKSDIDQLFGAGLGTTYPSNNILIGGEVYRVYEDLKYNYFLFPWLYVESGIIGIIFFIIIYLVIFTNSIIQFKKTNSFLSLTVLLMSITNILFSLYNTVLISSFLIYTLFWLYAGLLYREKKFNQNI